jgi:hypothetical protein
MEAERIVRPTAVRYHKDFIDFFINSELGVNTDRLQDYRIMGNFFLRRVGSLTLSVKLLDLWSKTQKFRNNSTKIIMDTNVKRYLNEALVKLKEIKLTNLREAEISGNAERFLNAQNDWEKFKNDEIQNKDFMIIVTTYRLEEPDIIETLRAYEYVIDKMIAIVRDKIRTVS